MNVILAQLGARQEYTIPLALQSSGLLGQLYTDIFLNNREAQALHWVKRTFKIGGALNNLLSRQHKEIDFSKVTRFLALGIAYKNALQKAQSTEQLYRAYIEFGYQFNEYILKKELPSATHLYAFDHAAHNLFQRAKLQGIRCVLDQVYPGPQHERIAAEEEALCPDWCTSAGDDFCESTTFKEWCDIQSAEWQAADKIIVASQYTKKAILAVEPALQHKLVHVPLTANLEAYYPFQRLRTYEPTRPLKVLYVGRVSAVKGIQYLLKAFKQIPPEIATLDVVGSIQIPPNKVAEYQRVATFHGPIPHYQIAASYQAADLFIFPTISDGFGSVMLEALATGLPVIATTNCGDIVEDGVNGYRVPIRDTAAIIDKIYQIHKSPELLTQLSQGALMTCQNYTSKQYQARLCNALLNE